jgi:isopenicillin-N epimerase
VRAGCRQLLRESLARIEQVTGQKNQYPDDNGLCQQMAVAALPPVTDLRALKRRLSTDYHIQIPCIEWDGRQFIRLSIQAYNSQEDVDALVSALSALLNQRQ